MRIPFVILLATFATVGGPPPHSCAGPDYRQFDFFAGDWDAYDLPDSNTIVARNHVTPMLGGCALREVYEQPDGLRGESFSAYDADRGVWHQSWVTNLGKVLLLDGRYENGLMTLSGTDHSDGISILRGIWRARSGGEVRETAERSRDDGKTWTPVFDILFRPHGVPPPRRADR